MIYIGADHRGYEIKEVIKEYLKSEGYEYDDVGAFAFNPDDDYVDFAIKVAEMVEGGNKDWGIVLCGSGHGADIVVNKFRGIRAILGFNRNVIRQGREDEDANILVLPANWINVEQAKEWVGIFLQTETSTEERHLRRRSRIANLRVK